MVLDGAALRCSGMVEIATPAGRLVGADREITWAPVPPGARVPRRSVRDRGALRGRRSASHRGQERATRPRSGRPRRNRSADRSTGSCPDRSAGATDEHACLTLNVLTPDVRRPTATAGARVVSRRRVHDRRRVATGVRRHARSARSKTSWSSRATTGSARSASSTPATSAASRTAGCATRSPRSSGCATTSRRSAVIPSGSRCSASRPAAASCSTCCASPLARGLFRGAIVQSGATFNTLDATRAALVREALLAELGVADAKLLARRSRRRR